ncbi:hypothetical protein [Pseudomonas sp. B33.4]|uniref:hypothetical protein n=1 Tax=Pseudomonas sp. B33.4 TaxID=3104265 RepID=UPI002ADEDE27|nr:hypothetical protein [Pseudomonas sp. B33.4]
MTYPEARFLKHNDHFLINSLQATPLVAFSGRQTPYPQKHQQRSGVTLHRLWKNAEGLDKSGLKRELLGQNRRLINN